MASFFPALLVLSSQIVAVQPSWLVGIRSSVPSSKLIKLLFPDAVSPGNERGGGRGRGGGEGLYLASSDTYLTTAFTIYKYSIL